MTAIEELCDRQQLADTGNSLSKHQRPLTLHNGSPFQAYCDQPVFRYASAKPAVGDTAKNVCSPAMGSDQVDDWRLKYERAGFIGLTH